MNLFLLPNLISLLIFFGAFRPLARRAGPRANDWFMAFAFVFVHEFAETFAPLGVPNVMRMTADLAIEIAAIAFMRAATWQGTDRVSLRFAALQACPFLAQTVVFHTRWSTPWLHGLLCVLFLLPFVCLRVWPQNRTEERTFIANAEALSSTLFALVLLNDPTTGMTVLHFALFAAAAVTCWRCADATTPGVRTATTGLALWAVSFPAQQTLAGFDVTSPVAEVLLRVPEYVVAYGIVLMLIERYVNETETLALHDPLTELPNRRLFDDRLEQAIAAAPESGALLACLIIDVDRFKRINDTLGHQVGDGLLQAVATRLSWHVGPGDTLARTGGDEFSAVLTRLQSLEHLRFIVGAMMSATCVPVVVGDSSLDVGLSIGIALFPQHGSDGDELRRNADDAMYEAKRSGGNQFAYFGGPPDEEAHLLAGVPPAQEIHSLMRR